MSALRGVLADVPVDLRYDDGAVRLDGEAVTLAGYYFPLGLPKRIPYRRIRGVSARSMGWLTGRGRLWGTGNPRYWLPLDLARPRRRVLVVLDVGRFVRPAFSPDDPDRVLELLRAAVQDGTVTD